MKVFDVIQGTPEWAQLRSGIPTASQFHRIITPSGEPSKMAEMYMFELLAERLLGEPTVEYTSHWMDRGSEFESEAVNFYEFTTDTETQKVGFILNDAGTVGASPDRLVGENGLLEIKVGKPSTHIGLLLKSGKAYEEHRIQTQGQLMVAEREWNDLMAYNPGLSPVIYRVEREEKFIRMLDAALKAFCEVMETQYRVLLERGAQKPFKRSTPNLVEILKQSLVELNKSA